MRIDVRSPMPLDRETPRPVIGISSMATKALLAELTLTCGAAAGLIVQMQSVGGVDAARRVREGEKLDLVVLASGVIDALEDEGRLVSGSRVDIAKSAIAVAVPAHAPRVPVGEEEDIRALVLRARAVAYSTGPSGDHLQALVQRWGIAEAVSGRMLKAPPGVPVASLLADGVADVGFQQLSELKDAHDVSVLGLLPASIQATTIFSAGVAATSNRASQVAGLLHRLAAPDTAEVKHRHGMESAA